MIVVLVGQIASGKSTLAECLEQCGFERIVTYTTRQPRGGETDGVDYHFISEQEFLNQVEAGFFAEHTDYQANFGHVYYGTSRESLDTSDGSRKVLVLNPDGVRSLKAVGYDIFVVYLDLSQETLMRRALRRGDKPVEIGRRIMEDSRKFDTILSEMPPDLHITAGNLLPNELAEWVKMAAER